MKRYAVQVLDVNGDVLYESIGLGLQPDPKLAHIYTRYDLALKKVNQYLPYKQWYQDATVIELFVIGFPEEK